MNEIQEYRKTSAEWMEFEIEDHPLLGKVYRDYESQFMVKVDEWDPTADLNQMGMIEDKLIREGCGILMDIGYSGSDPNDLAVSIWDGKRRYDGEDTKSKPIAFMKAFMEYIKSE